MPAETSPHQRSVDAVNPENADITQEIAELREAVRARDAFLDIAAHELRNPMSALLMQVERTLDMARRMGDAQLTRQIEQTERAVTRYVSRATTLLDISRINAGKLQLEGMPLDFAKVVRDVVESYAAEAAYFGAHFQVSVPDTLPLTSDALALEQVAGNLISNALKYGGHGPVIVTLTSEGVTAKLIVGDKGIGISQADQALIFGKFERLFTAEQKTGFGIGLWLVRQLVDALGGSIAVASAPGQGSTFTVTIPSI